MTQSTPTPAVSGNLGRFGHHPDHIIDYCVEVECIEAMCRDHDAYGHSFGDDDRPLTHEETMSRIWRANGFRVGVVEEALAARRILVGCVRKMEAVYVA